MLVVCMATIGQVGQLEHGTLNLGKAGRSWLGIGPTVRGSVMNPRDHPHGGGEGKAPAAASRRPSGASWPWEEDPPNKTTDRFIVRKRGASSR